MRAATTDGDVREQEILLDLVDNLDAMVAFWDIDRRCVFANEAYRSWFGISGRDLVGRTMEQLLGPLYPLNLPYIDAAYAGSVQVFERAIPTPDGGVRHSLATYTPHVVDGSVRGIFVHVADVTPLKRLELELREAVAEAERLATHDFLTGLPNRVLLEERVVQALERCRHTGSFLAVITIDLDDFKSVNDTHGHAAGDRLLVEAAARLRRSLRAGDSATRMGGDEFLLLLPEVASRADVVALARRVTGLMDEPHELAGSRLTIRCSLGIVLTRSAAVTPAALLAESDRALYEAKERDGACWAVREL